MQDIPCFSLRALGHTIREVDIRARIKPVGARPAACASGVDVIITGCVVYEDAGVTDFYCAVGARPYNCSIRDEGVPAKGFWLPAGIDGGRSRSSKVRAVARIPAADGVLCSGTRNREVVGKANIEHFRSCRGLGSGESEKSTGINTAACVDNGVVIQ